MELSEARNLCKELVEWQVRWGKHAGNYHFTEEQIREALITLHENGTFDAKADKLLLSEEKEKRIAASRARGAAEARAVRAQKIVDELREQNDKLRARVEGLEAELQTANEHLAMTSDEVVQSLSEEIEQLRDHIAAIHEGLEDDDYAMKQYVAD